MIEHGIELADFIPKGNIKCECIEGMLSMSTKHALPTKMYVFSLKR